MIPQPPRTVTEWLKVLLPIAADAAEEFAHAGDDREALDRAAKRHQARVWDEINRRTLGTGD